MIFGWKVCFFKSPSLSVLTALSTEFLVMWRAYACSTRHCFLVPIEKVSKIYIVFRLGPFLLLSLSPSLFLPLYSSRANGRRHFKFLKFLKYMRRQYHIIASEWNHESRKFNMTFTGIFDPFAGSIRPCEFMLGPRVNAIVVESTNCIFTKIKIT